MAKKKKKMPQQSGGSRPGRSPKKPEARSSMCLRVRVTDAEYKRIYSAKPDREVSAWVRTTLLSALDKEKNGEA